MQDAGQRKTQESAPNIVHVVGICGSLRAGSHTRMAVRLALAGAQELGASTQLIDLIDYQLVLCNGNEDESSYPTDVNRLRRECRAADGVILGTPEYHGSFSGVLKNALDLMGFEEFEGKMLGLVGVSGGAMNATNALTGLRIVGRALHSWVVPDQCGIGQAWKHFDADGNMSDDKLRIRLMDVGRQVARFAAVHSSQQFREFLQMWEQAPVNPGGD